MIVHGSYFGEKADVWSTGCILLELILGHERFCDVWMSAYDFDVLQDKVRFEDMIRSSVAALPDALEFPKDLKDFVIQFVKIRSSERPSVAELCRHTWMGDLFLTPNAGMLEGLGSLTSLADGLSISTSGLPGPFGDRADSPSHHTLDRRRSPSDATSSSFLSSMAPNLTQIAKMAGASFSDRERKLYEEHNTHVLQHEGGDGGEGGGSGGGGGEGGGAPGGGDGGEGGGGSEGGAGGIGNGGAVGHHQHKHDHHTLHLPPIDPQTPSVGKFRKILKKAEESLPPEQRWDPIEEESHHKGHLTSATSATAAVGRHHDAPEEDVTRPLKLTPRQSTLLSSASDPRITTST